MKRLATAAAVTCGLAFLTGCPNPNIYGTPRTTQKGKLSHVLAAEGISLSGKTANNGTISAAAPMFPSYHLRYGVSDEVDLGFKALNGSSLGADVKWNPVRGDFDLAFAPGLQFIYYSIGASSGSSSSTVSETIFYFHLPVLLGINLSDNVAIVATPGAVYALASGTVSSSGASTQQTVTGSGSAVYARFGLGLNLRLSKTFAIQPEVTAMRGFNDIEPLIIVGGLGFAFGYLPKMPSETAAPPDGGGANNDGK
jgi:hypothetical protein